MVDVHTCVVEALDAVTDVDAVSSCPIKPLVLFRLVNTCPRSIATQATINYDNHGQPWCRRAISPHCLDHSDNFDHVFAGLRHRGLQLFANSSRSALGYLQLLQCSSCQCRALLYPRVARRVRASVSQCHHAPSQSASTSDLGLGSFIRLHNARDGKHSGHQIICILMKTS